MADAIDRLGDDWLEEAGATPEPEVQEAPVEASEPEAQEAPKEEPEQQSDQVTEPEEKFNPTLYREMKEERAKRQAIERELEALRAANPSKPTAPPTIPDAYEEPAAFGDFFQNQVEQIKFEARLETSGFKAEIKHGEEKVKEAVEWATQQAAVDPTIGVRMRNHADPVGFIVNEYQQSRTLETIAGRPFEDAAKDYAIQQGWIVSPERQEAAPSPKPSPSKPPRGLASTPGTGTAAPKEADWGEVKFALDR